MTGTVIDDQVAALRQNVRDFIRCITSLPEDLFLTKMNGWAPRDVTAHFIGWNRASIRGSRDLMQGKTPYLLDDPGEDFSRANALLVKEISSRDRDGLVNLLRTSSGELAQFMLTLDPADWEKDWGVMFEGEPRTLQNSLGPLVEDYVNHRRQIEAWTEQQA
jgi:hypothetical protein